MESMLSLALCSSLGGSLLDNVQFPSLTSRQAVGASLASLLRTANFRGQGPCVSSILTITVSQSIWRMQHVPNNYLLNDTSEVKQLIWGLESAEVGHFEHKGQRANEPLHSRIYVVRVRVGIWNLQIKIQSCLLMGLPALRETLARKTSVVIFVNRMNMYYLCESSSH